MLIASTIAAAGSACAVGPNFQPPPAAAPAAYTREALPRQTQETEVAGGAAQRLEAGGDLPGEWWRLFGSAALEALIQKAMASYPDIAAQQAALRTAWDVFRAGEGAFMPQLQGNANQSREQQSGASIGPGYPGYISSVFQATVNVSYTLDVFGRERRLVEGLEAQAEAQNFQLEASYLTLTSNVASSAIQLASIREQIAVTHEIIALEEKQLATIRRQFELGS